MKLHAYTATYTATLTGGAGAWKTVFGPVDTQALTTDQRMSAVHFSMILANVMPVLSDGEVGAWELLGNNNSTSNNLCKLARGGGIPPLRNVTVLADAVPRYLYLRARCRNAVLVGYDGGSGFTADVNVSAELAWASFSPGG
jgi:hypothetical protein